jgi:hypothetical protein
MTTAFLPPGAVAAQSRPAHRVRADMTEAFVTIMD